MKLAIDTNCCVSYFRGGKDTLTLFQHADWIFVPFVVMAELQCGFVLNKQSQLEEKFFTQLLNAPRVSSLFPDEETTRHYAQLFAQLKKQGTPIPANDIWIAALVSQHNLLLHSRDSHFDHLPQLARI